MKTVMNNICSSAVLYFHHTQMSHCFPAFSPERALTMCSTGTDVGTIIASEPPNKPQWSFFSSCTGSDLKEPANNPFRSDTSNELLPLPGIVTYLLTELTDTNTDF